MSVLWHSITQVHTNHLNMSPNHKYKRKFGWWVDVLRKCRQHTLKNPMENSESTEKRIIKEKGSVCSNMKLTTRIFMHYGTYKHWGMRTSYHTTSNTVAHWMVWTSEPKKRLRRKAEAGQVRTNAKNSCSWPEIGAQAKEWTKHWSNQLAMPSKQDWNWNLDIKHKSRHQDMASDRARKDRKIVKFDFLQWHELISP